MCSNGITTLFCPMVSVINFEFLFRHHRFWPCRIFVYLHMPCSQRNKENANTTLTPTPLKYILHLLPRAVDLPGLSSPCNSETLHKMLDTPLVMLHWYVPKSAAPSGVTTRTSPNAFTLGDCVTVWLSFVQE